MREQEPGHEQNFSVKREKNCVEMQHKIEEQIQEKKKEKLAEVKGVMLHENNDKKSHEPARGVGVV